MSQPPRNIEPVTVVMRLRDATNAHDIEGIVGVLRGRLPQRDAAHPARGFVGNEQVRRNWTHILGRHPRRSTEIVAPSPPGTSFGASGSTAAPGRTATGISCAA